MIEYTENPHLAPKELQKLCAANQIVYSLVNPTGKIPEELPDNVLLLLAEYGLNYVPLEKAMASLRA